MRRHINDNVSKLLDRVWMGGMGDLMAPEAVGGSACSESLLTWSLPTVWYKLYTYKKKCPASNKVLFCLSSATSDLPLH